MAQDKPNLDNPRIALDSLIGASAPFKHGNIKLSITAQVVITRLGLLDSATDFADVIAIAYAMFDDGNKERVYQVFREASKGRTEFTVNALKWADELGITLADAEEVANSITEFFKKASEAQVSYKAEKGSAGNE